MPRVLLIGRGPLPSPDLHQVGFAQLRTRHFLAALSSAGCEVDLLLIEDDLQPGILDDAMARAARSDAVVSAGPHRPGALAVAAAGDKPLWVDIPGDPLAELQALLRAPGPPLPSERIAAAQAATHAVLARADAVSVISHRQAQATFGRLSAIGRDLQVAVPCAVLPIAFDFPLARRSPRTIPATGPIRMVLSGAFAPWLDDERLAEALSIAFTQDDRLELQVTGGGIEGHYTAGYARFSAWAARHPDRVKLHGWVPHARLEAILGDCHIGLCLDRPGAEPTLGGRTRVLLYAWMGLQVAAGGGCEQVGLLVDRGVVHPLSGDARTLANTLVSLCHQPPRQAGPTLTRHFSPANITAPLTEWVRSPRRVGRVDTAEALLAAQVEHLHKQLGDVHRSPTWRTLSRLHLLLRRLRS